MGQNHYKTHGMSNTREYKSWRSAKARCYNPKVAGYALYGGRGIKVCDEWRNNFGAFFRDVGWCPPGYSLDRIDANGDYEPGNVRWADARTQQRNRRVCRRLTHGGETQTIAAWAERMCMNKGTLVKRLDCYKWPVRKALHEPVKFRVRKSDMAQANRAGISRGAVHRRLVRGWPLERALTEPPHNRGQKPSQ